MLPTRLRISACLIAATATVAACGGASATAPTAAAPALPADVGYVRIGSFGIAVAGADRIFADSIQDQIRQRDAANLAGWIVDVRGNGGGNMWPMVAGVGPVLGEGVAGFFLSPT